MTELLLRGAQTLGELRGRAARMEPIKDIGALQPIVDSLRQKGLLIYLSSPGRGGVVTHNLYQPQELAKLRSEQGAESDAMEAPGSAGGPSRTPATPASPSMSRDPHSPTIAYRSDSATPPSKVAGDGELQRLSSEMASLKRELAELREQSETATSELRRELEDLKNQLGV
jgi:uncharacterized protein YceH (UPF0502 family)